MLERTHRPKGLERQFCCFLGWSTFVFLILVLAEGHFGRVGQLPLFTPSCRTPTVIHWMNGLWQVWSSHRLPFNLFQGGLSCKSFGWYLFFASFLFSTGFWNISLHWCDFIPDKILHLVVSKISSLCDFYNIVLLMIILVAILTNFQRMNGTDGLRGHEADRGGEANYGSKGVLLLAHLLHHLLSLHPYTHRTAPLLLFLFLQLLLHQPLSALPNSTAPRSTLRLLFLGLPPAASGNHPPSITSIEAANISSLRPNFQPPISYFGRCGACPCRHLLTEWIILTFILLHNFGHHRNILL